MCLVFLAHHQGVLSCRKQLFNHTIIHCMQNCRKFVSVCEQRWISAQDMCKVIGRAREFECVYSLQAEKSCSKATDTQRCKKRHADIQTDGQTDMMKLIVAFRSFTNAPKMICKTPKQTPSKYCSSELPYLLHCSCHCKKQIWKSCFLKAQRPEFLLRAQNANL